MSDWPQSLILVGAGKMGEAMLHGWLAAGLEPGRIAILEPKPSPAIVELSEQCGIPLNPALDALTPPEALFLAIKPQTLEAAAPALAPLAGQGTLIVSILAGKRIADLSARLPQAGAFVRVMSNTPAAVGAFEWLADEALIDAVTALSGSGPAYVFALVEAMAAAGESVGLPADLAMKLARATVEGAGELLHREPGVAAGKLRENVTSPGGTTAAVLSVLRAPDGLTELMTRAIVAAHKRAGELAG
ncbi:MAG: pyrroline-5-carboxylate reductase [Hyphomicrobiales bacterium]|nr:pyrroline-5-carboxylate reductase [Hyphomicrobiales bacterium]